MITPFRLRIDAADGLGASWAAALIAEVAVEQGWSLDDGGAARPDAVALIGPLGDAVAPIDEPAFVVAVEAGTPRSPVVVESAAHLPARFELVVGEFKARRNQQVTRDAVERFLTRVAGDRPGSNDPSAPQDPAEGVVHVGAEALVAENRALIAAVDAWLARTTLTPAAAQAVGADRTILEAAIGAPVIDLVIVERVATRLAATIHP